MSEKKFYVYEHWRTDRNECFYVGKGHGRRAYDMRRGRNRWHKFLQAKLSHLGTAIEVKIVADGLTEREALDFEIERIAFWKNDGADLCNLTDGGDGTSGRKHTEGWKKAVSERMRNRQVSKETCAKISAAVRGNKNGLGKKRPSAAIEATRAAHLGSQRTAEQRAKISLGKKGQVRSHTPEEDLRASLRQKGIPKPESVKANMRGIPKSETHKQKLREANLGKSHSNETREKLATIAREGWIKRRAAKSSDPLQLNITFDTEES